MIVSRKNGFSCYNLEGSLSRLTGPASSLYTYCVNSWIHRLYSNSHFTSDFSCYYERSWKVNSKAFTKFKEI